ncbi:MAG: sugar phosphate isomerase/epimerase [Deltaproteobacteria bacterium]|nr:MAG: sugar phosphate isomerase/epimerase [Deltaproteobacteria bacterium]
MIVQTTVPYEILLARQDEAIRRKIHPEIYFDSFALDKCRDEDVRRLGEALSLSDISYTFHAPYMDLAPGGVDSKIRMATRERLEEILHLAALIRPKVVVCHPGYDKWRYGEFQDLWFKGSVEMWAPLVKRAEDLGVTLALENVFEEGPETLEMLLEAINSPHFGFCFDTGHWLVFGKIGWEEWIRRLGNRLVEVHIHDNNGKEDQHLPPGDGKFDFPKFFRFLGNQQHTLIYTLEVHQEEELARSFEMVRKYLKGTEEGGS